MRTRSFQKRPLRSSDRLAASIQPKLWSDDSGHEPLLPPADFSHVDLFAHAPQRVPVQMKLTVGAPNDQYEQEADTVAQEVMSTPDSAIQSGIQRQATPPTQASLQARLPSAQESEASGRALGQRPQIAERAQPGRIHRCGGGKKDKDKKTADKTPEKPPEVKAPDPIPVALAADELILSSDPQYAKAEFVSWFQGKVKATLEAWKLAFDPNAIQLKAVLLSGGATPAVVLNWNAAWGTPPVSTDIPFSMQPIDARAAVISAHNLPGWSKLTAPEQTTLDAMLGGEVNQLSARARANLRTLFPTLAGKTEVEQEQALRGLLSDKAALPSAVAEPVTTTQIAYTLTGPTEQKDYEFKGKKADAEIWAIKFQDGVETTIVAPKAPEPGHHNHSVQQAAESASYLPKANRSVITKIMLNAVVNPDDAHWAAEYKTPDFHSYMTAGVAGVVTIYPDKATKALPSDNYMRGTMVHETGHTWSYKAWGTDKTKGKWLEWKQAMTDDQVSVSGYATNSIAEDVAETIQIYVTTKGSPRFNEYRQIVPKRFAMLDTEYK
jgi:hypothetical protein